MQDPLNPTQNSVVHHSKAGAPLTLTTDIGAVNNDDAHGHSKTSVISPQRYGQVAVDIPILTMDASVKTSNDQISIDDLGGAVHNTSKLNTNCNAQLDALSDPSRW